MRNILNLNEGWLFVKNTTDVTLTEGEQINVPHSWNAIDGQDGGNDYFRGPCLYKKTLVKADLPEADLYYIEFCGTNSSADLYVNGNKLATHHGGYSTWRVNITDALTDSQRSLLLLTTPPTKPFIPRWLTLLSTAVSTVTLASYA